MNKAISKAVMNRARFRNKFLNNRSAENKLAYNLQRNYCASLTHQRGVITTILITGISPIAIFFGTVKLSFSDKVLSNRKSHLLKLTKSLATIQKFLRFSTIFSRI